MVWLHFKPRPFAECLPPTPFAVTQLSRYNKCDQAQKITDGMEYFKEMVIQEFAGLNLREHSTVFYMKVNV